jgi:hypothetical protein
MHKEEEDEGVQSGVKMPGHMMSPRVTELVIVRGRTLAS